MPRQFFCGHRRRNSIIQTNMHFLEIVALHVQKQRNGIYIRDSKTSKYDIPYRRICIGTRFSAGQSGRFETLRIMI
uniref:Uncharacterized protein n=1 Tax=Arundo donax TaxID=35708 RepID=A0A0A9CH08_ARUDO